MTIGDDAIYKEMERIPHQRQHFFTIGGRIYLPVRVCEALGKYAFYDSTFELVILSDEPNIYDSEADYDTLWTIAKIYSMTGRPGRK